VVLSLDVSLKLGTRAPPFVEGLGVSGRQSKDWKEWACTTAPYQRGRVLTMGLKTPGANLAFYGERYSKPAAPGKPIVDFTGKSVKIPVPGMPKKKGNATSVASSLAKFLAEVKRGKVNALRMRHLSVTEMSDEDVTAAAPAATMTKITLDLDPSHSKPAIVQWFNRRLGESASNSSNSTPRPLSKKSKFKHIPHTGPNTGAFNYQCAQDFAQYNIQSFSKDAQQVLKQVQNDSDFFLPFKGKYKYECRPPKGVTWSNLAATVERGKCLPCYKLQKQQSQVGSAPPLVECKHVDEYNIRKIHPMWKTFHSPNLPESYDNAATLMDWGITKDMARHGTCNYIGCSSPGIGNPDKLVHGPITEELGESFTYSEFKHGAEIVHTTEDQNREAGDLGESAGAGGPGDTYTEKNKNWNCGTNLQTGALIRTRITAEQIIVRTIANAGAVAGGFSAACAKDLLNATYATVEKSYENYYEQMNAPNYFNRQVAWNATVQKVMNCKCAGYYDMDGKGGACRRWDFGTSTVGEQGTSAPFWCYSYGTCDMRTALKTSKKMVSTLKKYVGCCADDHNYKKECKEWAKAGKCWKGGEAGDGAEVREVCPESCLVCKKYDSPTPAPTMNTSNVNAVDRTRLERNAIAMRDVTSEDLMQLGERGRDGEGDGSEFGSAEFETDGRE